MQQIISLLFGKATSTLVMVVVAIAGLFGLRWKVRANAKEELKNEIQGQILRRQYRAEKEARTVDNVSDADLDGWMRDKGWIK